MVNATMKASYKLIFFWGLFVTILCASGYLTYIFFAREIYNYGLWQNLVRDPDHRWQPHERPDINSDGLRSLREAAEFHEAGFNVIFAGDSFTFGHLLGYHATPPSQFEKIAQNKYPNKNINVVNFGWSSSSPYLSLRLLKDHAKKYNPDLVIFILDATDYKDDFVYRGIIEKRGGFKFIIEHPVLAHFPRTIARKTDNFTHWQEKWLGYPDFSTYFLLHQPYEKSVPFFDETYKNLAEMNDYVTQELDAKFVVFIAPRHWQYTKTESPLSREAHNFIPMGPYVLNNFVYFDEKAKSAPFPIISLLDDFSETLVFPTTFKKDSHWNPDGARLAAEFIFQHCQQIYCFP